MVMEESAMHPHHESHVESGGDASNADSNRSNGNVYLVGLEFVRQYYTVLNQGPLYLHRFYSDDSAFVHGASARDSNKVSYGQQEIHKRIQSLNFHNCHAKIRQVDSHETLGKGVVIQVTGELSNNGQPMRRFMQTFVLAPQSPKRYYVRNDVFHYQDEVFTDDDGDRDTPVESGLENEDGEDNDHEPIAVVEINGGGDIIPRELTSGVEVSVKMSSPPRMTPPAPKSEDDQQSFIAETSLPDTVVTVSADGNELEVAGSTGSSSSNSALPTNNEDDASSVSSINNVINTNISSAPKTYANLFKVPSAPIASKPGPVPSGNKFPPGPPPSSTANKGANGPRAGSPGNSQFSVNTNDNTTSPPQISPQSGGVGVKGLPPRGGNPRGGGSGFQNRDSNRDRDNNRPPHMERDAKDRRERLTSRSSTALNDETGSVDGDRRRPGPVHTYPDANQLFVGNLPHFVTVQDMKDIFQPFGEVAEVKIQKPIPKSGGMKVPYFCFIVFEDASSAQAAVDRKSEIFMKMNGGGQRRLNVEQKRSQRAGRMDGDHNDAPYNRMDSSSPAGNRPSDGMMRGSRTFRGSNRGGGPGGDRDRNDRGGHMGGRGGGGNMNSGGRGGGGGMGGGSAGRGNNNNKP